MTAGLVLLLICSAFAVWLFYPLNSKDEALLAEGEAVLKKLEGVAPSQTRNTWSKPSDSYGQPQRQRTHHEDSIDMDDFIGGDD